MFFRRGITKPEPKAIVQKKKNKKIYMLFTKKLDENILKQTFASYILLYLTMMLNA